MITATVYVICEACGKKHLLEPGGDAPIYYCRQSFPAFCKRLIAGDEVEYEEVKDG